MMRYRHHPSSYAWCFSTSIQNTVGDEIPCKKISIVFAYYNQNNHKIQLHVLPMTSFDLEVAPVNICHDVSGVQLVGTKKSTYKCLSPLPSGLSQSPQGPKGNQQWKSPI